MTLNLELQQFWADAFHDDSYRRLSRFQHQVAQVSVDNLRLNQ